MRRTRIALREAAALRREKTIVLAILVQVLVAGFSSFLFVGLVGLYAPGGGTVAVGVAGNATPELRTAIAAGEGTTAVIFDNRTTAVAAFDRRAVDALLLGPINASGTVHVTAVAPAGDFRTTLVVVELRDTLARLERQLRIAYTDRLHREPLAMPAPGTGSALYGLGYTVLLPMLVFLPAFIAGSIAVDSIAEELETNTLDLLRVTPLTPAEIIDGKALTTIGSAPLQAIAWLGLLTVNGTTVAHPVTVVVLVTGYATVATALGTAIATFTPRRRDAQLLYSASVLLVVGIATQAPESPVNTIAKLGIGTPTQATWGSVAATVTVALGGYALARWVVTTAIGTD